MSIYDHDPVEFYNLELKEAYSNRVRRFLADNVENSGIDTAANEALAKNINGLISAREEKERKKIFWIIITVIVILIAVIWGIGLWGLKSDGKNVTLLRWLVYGVYCAAAAAAVFGKCIPVLRRTGAAIAGLNTAISEKIAIAKAQLAPFFSLLEWDSVIRLMEEIFPHAVYDKFLYRERLEDLWENFDLDREFTGNRSVLCTHSGTLFGYPFIFLNTNIFEWGEKTYTGSITIQWTAIEKDNEGKSRTVTKTEILTASITRPCPEFKSEKILIFGHDAAPELSFSRSPSSLSGAGNSFFAGIGKTLKMSKLKRLERNLEDDSDFTMMSNRDFELLFHAVDRDDEIAFRLLYTPLAQQYMVKLLNDEKSGFGDDFMYFKSRRITTVVPAHLNDLEFSTAPVPLDEYDLKTVLEKMQRKFEDFFKRIYFSFAPLLTVPLYLEHRPSEVKTDAAEASISEWELESIANYQGENCYCHPDSITGNLLKVHDMTVKGSCVSARVTATGFKGIPRTEFVTKRGGDGKLHSISVEWIEYIQVDRTSSIHAENASGMTEEQKMADGRMLRRGILAAMPAADCE